MCGITGIIKTIASREITNQTITMLETIKHRGPDGEGLVLIDDIGDVIPTARTEFMYNFPDKSYHPKRRVESLLHQPFQIAFGHRRLSILDTSPQGHQPMCSHDEMIWLTFNGEIYNYIEIRQDLEKRGHKFTTGTDTEVLIEAYKAFGVDCLSHFNGMFAFVIFDKTKNQIFAARDRTGVKPFYYIKNADTFAFASEHKALLSLPFVKAKMNHKAVFDFFIHGAIEAEEEGLFANIFELLPSHYLTIDLNHVPGDNLRKAINIKKYYELEPNSKFEKFDAKTFETHRQKTHDLVQNSIKLRLRSDVSVGSCLSGGVDSSTVVCTINNLLRQAKKGQYAEQIGSQQKVFTSCFEDKNYDEQKWAKLVVDQTKAEWFRTFPTREEMVKDLETVIYCQDIPVYSSSTYAQFRVMKMVSESGVKVVLDGQGADELFGGYEPHYAGLWQELFKNLQFLSLAKALKATDKISSSVKFWTKSLLKYNGISSLSNTLQNRFNLQYFNDLQYLNKDWIIENIDRYNEYAEQRIESLSQMLHYEYFGHPLKQLLKCEDRCSMWFGIESRTPFADDLDLMNYAFAVPSSYKIQNGIRKHLLREAFKNDLPKPIYNRHDKMGFVTPTNQWMREMRSEIRPYFEQSQSDIFDKKLLLNDFDKFFNPATNLENYRVFRFISFAIWEKVFFSNS
jgi:asparagine synthase (glutamine-hydrolysing)